MKQFFMVLCLVITGIMPVFSQAVGLDAAIVQMSNNVHQNIPAASVVALPIFEAPVRVSDYVLGELSRALINGRSLKLVEQTRIDQARESLAFSSHSPIPDPMLQRVGWVLGAQYIITGTWETLNASYQISIRTIRAENAEVVQTFSVEVSKSDPLVEFLSVPPSEQQAPESQPEHRAADESLPKPPPENSGIYVGIVSFGADARTITGTQPVFLDDAGYKQLMNVLDQDYSPSTRRGTAVYYGVHRAVASLSQNAEILPENLNAVNIVTFIEGIDTGSTSIGLQPIENRNFRGQDSPAYQSFIQQQIANRPVAGRSLSAYALGVQGTEVKDTASFTTTLQTISSKNANAYLLTSIDDASEQLKEIARSIEMITTRTTLRMLTPSYPVDTKVRVTFDGATSAQASTRYFEGTVALQPDRQGYALTNIQYVGGVNSNAGNYVMGRLDGQEVTYIFDDFRGLEGSGSIGLWSMESRSLAWQVVSEYRASDSITTKTEVRSSVVYLVLDASISIDTAEIDSIRNAAKEFIGTLYGNSGKTAPALSLTMGTLAVSTVSAVKIRIIGAGVNQLSEVKAGSSYTQTFAPGTYSAIITYDDGYTETQTIQIEENRQTALSFTRRQTSVPSQPSRQPATAVTPAGFVQIQNTTFSMGSPLSEPGRSGFETQHWAVVDSFFISKYEVTQKEYSDVMGINPSSFKGNNLPVESISWYDTIEYCNARSRKEGLTPAYTIDKSRKDPANLSNIDKMKWVVTWNQEANGYRLPTEAEWEYACRAGTTTPFSTGNNITTNQANYDGNYPYNGNVKGIFRQQPSPVGSFPANALGLYDMHGNVWEWCWDWFGDYDTNTVAGSYRVARGGSWDYYAQRLRSAARGRYTPAGRYNGIGFRVVRS